MLKKRVIFTLLYDDGFFMLSRNFRLQKVGDLKWLKKNYNFSKLSFSIDELVVLDVTRVKRNQDKFLDHVRALSEECFIPIAAGGGIQDIVYAHQLISNGADKIVINSLISQNIKTVQHIASELGSQCIIASVDVKKIKNDFIVFTENGTKRQTFSLDDYFYKLMNVPVGEVYLNSVDRDGTAQGYMQELIEQIPGNYKLPIIISGGAGKYQHFMEGIKNERVDAVSTAHLFNFVGSSLKEARFELLNEGLALAKWDMSICESMQGFFEC